MTAKRGKAKPRSSATGAVQTFVPAQGSCPVLAGDAFDPWTAGLEEARAADVRSDCGSTEMPASCRPLAQWDAARRVTNCRLAVECGDGFAVLEGVAACVAHGLVVPDWLASAFLSRYRAVQQLRADSWDAEIAFGKPYPKGTQLARLRVRRTARLQVAKLVQEFVAKNPDLPVDVARWEEVGRAANVGKTLAQELHAEAVSMGLTQPVSELRAAHARSLQPANPRKVAGRGKKNG